MSNTIEALEIEVLALTPQDRSRLLDRLIESLDDDKVLNEAWDNEAARRDAEVEDGTSVPIDVKQVTTRLKAQIR